MFVYGHSLKIILCILRIEYSSLTYTAILSKLNIMKTSQTRWPLRRSSLWMHFRLSVDSLYQAVASNSEVKISKTSWLNKSMVLINLTEAPLISSRSSLQHSSVAPSRFGGLGEKGKAWHTVTAGNLNSRWASPNHHWEFPDWMSNLCAILATARSA